MLDRRARKRAAAIGCLVAAGTGLGVGISEASASSPPRYRTAVATVSNVEQTIGVSGTLQPVNQASAAFQVSGTVASVAVTPGQQVQAGQTIATLDPTLLQQQVTAAQSALTAAQSKLSDDESDASTASAVLAPGTPGIELTSATLSGPDPGAGTGSPPADLSSAIQAVVAAQHRADTDLQTARADLGTVVATCSASTPPPAPTTTPTSTTSPTTTPTTTPATDTTPGTDSTTTDPSTTSTSTSGTSTPATPTTGGSGGDSCQAALAAAESAQQQVATDQQTLATAESQLAQLLAASAASATPSRTTPGTAGGGGPAAGNASSTARSQSTGRAATTTGGSVGASAPTDTPAQLATDQTTVDSDDAAVAQAQQSLAAAALTSPIAGQVASVAMVAGQAVTSGSSSAVITIVDPGGYQASAALTTSQVQQVKTGDRAQVTVDGENEILDATLSVIGPVDTANSSYTYPVTLAITSPAGSLPVGSTARIQISVAGADHVVVVPSSAVHTTANRVSFVILDRNGTESRQRVTVGVVGPVYTEIESGIRRGQAVVLADPSQAVPASNTNSTAGGTGGGFRFGGNGIGALLRGGQLPAAGGSKASPSGS